MDDTLIVGHYHDDVDVLHVPMMMKKPNNGEDKQWRSHTVLIIFCTNDFRNSHKKIILDSLEASFPNESYTILKRIFPLSNKPSLNS